MTISIGRLCAFFCVLFLSLPAFSASYYVKTGGSDAAACTSDGAACATLAGAIGKAAASGDTIYVNRGDTFQPTIVNVTKSVTIDAYGAGALPIISGQNIYPTSNFSGLLHVTAANVTIKNLHIKDSAGGGIRCEGAANCVVDGVFLEHTYRYAVQARNTTGFNVRNSTATGANWGQADGLETTWSGVFTVFSVTDYLMENNLAYDNTGENYACTQWGGRGIVRGNTSRGIIRVGAYVNSCYDITIENNTFICDATATSSHPIAGIGLNNENYAYPGLSPTQITKNIRIFNNLIAACPIGIAYYGAYSGTSYSDVSTIGNELIDNKYGFYMAGTSAAQTNGIIANNIVYALTGGTTSYNHNGATSFSGIDVKNNWWQTTPSGSWSVGSNQIGTLTIDTTPAAKTWRTLTSSDTVPVSEWIPQGGSLTIDNGASTFGTSGYSTGYYGNAYVNDIGPFVDGGAPVDPPASGSSITSLSAAIAASTAGYTATGTELSGVYSATIDDGVDSQALLNVIGKVNATEFVFDTDTLTSIDTSNYTITATLDEPDLYTAAPISWTANGTTIASQAGTYGIFNTSATIIPVGTASNRAIAGTITPVSGQPVRIEFYVTQFSGSENVWSAAVRDTTASENTICYATLGGATTVSTDAATSGLTCTQSAGADYTTIVFEFNAEDSNPLRIELGSGNTAKKIIAHGVRAWVNRTPALVEYEYSTVTTPVITNINTDNELDPNAEQLITGTTLKNLVYGTVTDADTTYTYQAIPAAADGLTSKFRAAELTNLTGTIEFTGYSANSLFSDHNPRAWANNYGGTLADYATTALGISTATTITSAGETWNSAIYNNAFTAVAGQPITIKFITEPGSSGRFRGVVSNQGNGEYIEAAGIYGGGITATGSTACSASSVTEYNVGSQVIVDATCTLINGGTFKFAAGPYYTSGDVHFYGVDVWSGTPAAMTPLTVTVAGGGTVEPGLTKKVKFATATNTDLTCRSASAGSASAYSSAADGEIYIIIGDGNPRPAPGDPFPTILAYDSDATIVSGEYELIESELEYGSINALLTGAQGYYMWGANADGSCRWSAPVQVVAE